MTIKHLFLSNPSAKLEKAIATQVEKDASMKKSCEHNPKGVTCEKCDGTQSAKNLHKSLTSRMLSMVVSHKQHLVPPPIDPEFRTEEVQLFGPQVAQAAHIQRDFEPPVVPAILIPTPMQAASPLAPDFLTSCCGCGYTHKSLSKCPRCAQNEASNRTAVPFWRR